VSATHPYCSMDVGIDDDEFVWTKIRENKPRPLHRGLQELESCMRCQICGSFFHSPVSVQGCFHTFCSECIRGAIRAGKLSIRRTALCPICRNPIDGNVNDCLLPNRSVEEMVYKFKQLRGNLIATLAASPESSPSVLHHNDDNQNNATATLKSSTNHKESGEEIENSKPDKIITAMEPRKKIPKTFYNGMKRKKLQEKCRELGLSDQGTDHELKSRHQDYVTLYNAECDSLHPRSPLELVRMIHEREKAIRVSDKRI
jgi:Zinc finger, C3HC4 type (RING finger)